MDEMYSFTHRNYISFSVTFSIFVHIDFYFPEYSLFPNFSFLLNSSLFLKSSMFPYFFFFQTISCTDCFLFLPLSSFLSFFLLSYPRLLNSRLFNSRLFNSRLFYSLLFYRNTYHSIEGNCFTKTT